MIACSIEVVDALAFLAEPRTSREFCERFGADAAFGRDVLGGFRRIGWVVFVGKAWRLTSRGVWESARQSARRAVST
jgi:hypothetical protein